MSLGGEVQCNKIVVGACGPDLTVEPGETITWELTIVNTTAEEVVLSVEDPAPMNTVIESTTVTPENLGGATGAAATELPIAEYVTLPPRGSVRYVIEGLVSPTAPCLAQVTNCARITQIIDGAPCPEEPKFATSETVTVVPEGADPRDAKFCVEHDGFRSLNFNELLYCLFGDECNLNFLMDMLTAGENLGNLIRPAFSTVTELPPPEEPETEPEETP